MNAQIGAAKAHPFPAISLTGVLGASSSQLPGLFEGPSSVWSCAGSITRPLFAGGAVEGAVRQTEASREAALLGYQHAVESAFADVENAPGSRAELAGETQARVRLVRAASEYVRLASRLASCARAGPLPCPVRSGAGPSGRDHACRSSCRQAGRAA